MSIEIMQAVWRHSQSQGRARLVLLAIADHQGEIGAWPSIGTLAKMVNASERSVQRDIVELQELGELTVDVQNAPINRQYKSNLYWVTLPGLFDPMSGVTDLVSGVTDIASGVTDSASGVTAGGVRTITKPLIEPLLKQMSKTDEKSFEDFWSAYPRKEKKPDAMKSFLKALKRASAETLISNATRYANDPNRNPGYTKLPTTWLNNDCWNDPLIQAPVSVNVKQVRQQQAATNFLNSFKQPLEITSEPDWA